MPVGVHRLLPPGAPPPLAILGTTASGKSALAMELARNRGDVELVSVDSMQVYRGMDIGTAKPSAAEQAEVRHHLIDVVDPWESFEVHSFQAAVGDALADIAARGKRAVLVGGTGLYLQAVVDGFEIPGQYPDVAADLESDPDTDALYRRLQQLDAVAAERMDPSNRRRVVRALEVTLGSGRPFSSFGPGIGVYEDNSICQVGVRLPQPVVGERIERRYHQQMADGFLDEVDRLLAGPQLSRTAAQALGYRELIAWRSAEAEAVVAPASAGSTTVSEPAPTLDGALDEAIRRTRKFARRQRAWFRRDPRITWLDAEVDPMARREDLLRLAADHWS